MRADWERAERAYAAAVQELRGRVVYEVENSRTPYEEIVRRFAPALGAALEVEAARVGLQPCELLALHALRIRTVA